MAGVSLSHWPVSHTSARSAVTSLPCAARKPGSDGEPHSSSPSISTVMRTGQAPASVLPGPRRLEEGHELALVVLRAARDDHLAVELVGGDARLERRRFPQLQRIGRLHVVVAVEQHVRGAAQARPCRGRRPWDAPWSAPPWRRSRCPGAGARTTAPPCGSAACMPGPWRRWGCGSARTAAPAPHPAWRRGLSGPWAGRRSWARWGTLSDCVLADVMEDRAMIAASLAPLSTAAGNAVACAKSWSLGTTASCREPNQLRRVERSRVFSVAARTDMGRRHCSELVRSIRRQRVERTA